MLGALVAADPARVSGRHWWLRRLSITLVMALVVVALLSTAVLITDLVSGAKVTESASRCSHPEPSSGWATASPSASSTGCWTPAGRWRATGTSGLIPTSPSPNSSARARPTRVATHVRRHLVLGLSTSMAFSPTDVMPVVPWAKLTMTLQSLISLTVIALVIARAVNAFA